MKSALTGVQCFSGLATNYRAVFLLTGAIGVTNYSSIAIATPPEEKCGNDAIKFLAGSLILFILAFLSVKIEALQWIGSVFALIYREFVYRYTLSKEKSLFIPSSAEGSEFWRLSLVEQQTK